VYFPDAPKNCYGIVGFSACRVEMAKMPDKGKAYCQKIKKELGITSFQGRNCPEWAAACGEDEKKPPDTKCEKPTPWFGTPSNCSDVQSPEIETVSSYSLFTLSICGYPVFRYFVPEGQLGGVDLYKAQLANFVKKRVGSKICCDKLREAVRTGKPCNPENDIDCDGKSNQEDFYYPKVPASTLPDINNLFSSPEGAPIDPFPAGLNPDDPDFLPPPDKCDCKWELVKGTLNCSPDGKQRHFYEARWRCPSTGNERYTRKYATPTTECP